MGFGRRQLVALRPNPQGAVESSSRYGVRPAPNERPKRIEDGMAKLEQCPNFAVCQTYVAANRRGMEHKYGVSEWSEKTKQYEIVYKTCSGG
jgi:hypothetical protein